MAIQKVDKSSLTKAQIAELLGLTLNGDYMSKEGGSSDGFKWLDSNWLYIGEQGGYAYGTSAYGNMLLYEKTENSCVFGFTDDDANNTEYMNFGYTLATNLLTGKKQYVYFFTRGDVGYMKTTGYSSFHSIKSTLINTSDSIVSMANYYIPEFELICDDLYSIVTFKSVTDFKHVRFSLNGNYYIKPSGIDAEKSGSNTYSMIAVRVG